MYNEKGDVMKYLKRLSEWCYRVINLTVLLAATLIFILFMVLVLPSMAGQLEELTGVSVSPDTSFYYSAGDLYEMAELYGEEGRSYYIYSRFTFDIVWPAVYLAFLVTSLTCIFRNFPRGSSYRLVNLLPFFGAFFDLLENSAASLVMYRFPLPTPVIVNLAPLFTVLKWCFIFLSFIALGAGLLILISRRYINSP